MRVTQVNENMEPIASREIPDPVEVQIPLLSVRDYFAAHSPFTFPDLVQIMQLGGIVGETDLAGVCREMATLSLLYADAMMEVRNGR